MILDAKDFSSGSTMRADICIVGAGAAGVAMALALIDSGLKVLLLESGGYDEESETQDLYSGEVADELLHSPVNRYRMRRLGGSTTVWGGRCMPFDPIDFETRDYLPHSGWPIGYEDLLPFYPHANSICEAGDFSYTTQAGGFSQPLQPMIPDFRSADFSTDTLERFSCPTNFGQRYRRRLAAANNLHLVLHANVTAIRLGPTGRSVTGVSVRTLSGVALEIEAGTFVLATGGLETARLLLNSPGTSGRGLGNAHDQVGRYYMCHVAGTIGTLRIAKGKRAWHGYDISDEGIYCRRRLAFRPDAQRRLGVGNFVARLHHPRMTDPRHRTGILSLLCLAKFMIPYEYAKRLYGEERSTWTTWLAHVRNVLLDLPGVVGFLWHWLNDRTLATRKFPSIIVHPKAERYSIDFHAEQVPNPDSRVTLSDERDVLGMRKLKVDWRYMQQDVDTVREALAALARDLQSSGAGTLDYAPDAVEHEMTRYGAYGGHHIGTTRMGVDPAGSVVDAHCKVHETDNLYIAGSSVFPTSSQANPTLTIVALALRLASRLTIHTPRKPSPMTLKVLILGANGFVGRKIVQRLASSGWATPVAATRKPVDLPGAENVCLDAADAAMLSEAIAKVDCVVNCVAGPADVMVRCAQALRTALTAVPGKAPRLVHFSSMAVYGSAVGKVTESQPLQGDLGPYSSAKVEAEKILGDVPNVVVLRPGCIFGPDSTQWSERIARLLRARRIGDLGPGGDACSNLVYIDNVVDAVLAALRMDAAAGQAFNLAMRGAPTWNEYFVAYGRALGAVPVRRITPRRLKIERRLAIPLKILEMVGRRLRIKGTPAVLTPSMLGLWQQDIQLQPDAAESTLGLSWTPLETALKATS